MRRARAGVVRCRRAWNARSEAGRGWTAAQEYVHALHAESLGGLWPTENCAEHDIWVESSYTCALQEGIADYGASIGAPYEQRGGVYSYETIPSDADDGGEVEGNVAAMFHDLLDSANEGQDQTHYNGRYVLGVFRTCEIRMDNAWRDRNDVSDIVWCLEEGVDARAHERHFGDLPTPAAAREDATEPGSHSATHIRNTWVQDVGT